MQIAIIQTFVLIILTNPVMAKQVNKPQDWEFSSYRDSTDTRDGTLISFNRINELGLSLM